MLVLFVFIFFFFDLLICVMICFSNIFALVMPKSNSDTFFRYQNYIYDINNITYIILEMSCDYIVCVVFYTLFTSRCVVIWWCIIHVENQFS